MSTSAVASAVTVNGVSIPLLHAHWLEAVRALLPGKTIAAPSSKHMGAAAMALLSQDSVFAAKQPPEVWALVLASANPSPPYHALQWMAALTASPGSHPQLPPLALLYWAKLASRCKSATPDMAVDGGDGAVALDADVSNNIHRLLQCSDMGMENAVPTAAGGLAPRSEHGHGHGGADMLDASRQPAPIINIAQVDTMRAVVRGMLRGTSVAADDAAVTHVALVLVALQTVAEAAAALHEASPAGPCGVSHIAPFAADELVMRDEAGAGAVAAMFPALATCALVEAAAGGAKALHCTAVSLQVSVLRPLAECVRRCLQHMPALAADVYVQAFEEHLEAACGTPRYSTMRTTPADAALADHLDKGVKAPVPQAVVVHDLYLGPWHRLLAQARGIMTAGLREYAQSSATPATHQAAATVEACLQGGTSLEFEVPNPVLDACRTALYALMDLRAWGEYETLVLQNWDACPLSARKWQGTGPAPGTSCPLHAK
jgi:hypothetical protein